MQTPALLACSDMLNTSANDVLKTKRFAEYFHMKKKKRMKQNAINPPMMNPSLRFLADILPISELMPGT